LLEKRQSVKISCIEEIAFSNGWIDKKGLLAVSEKYGKSTYSEYLIKVVNR